MNKEVAIIGVNGKMGKWFADYFHKWVSRLRDLTQIMK